MREPARTQRDLPECFFPEASRARERVRGSEGAKPLDKVVEAAGVEPDCGRFGNFMTACRLWSQLLMRQRLWFDVESAGVLRSPLKSTGVLEE
jgi:hypothetical protein